MINSLTRPILFLSILLSISFFIYFFNDPINVERKAMVLGKDSILMIPKSNVTILYFDSAVSKVKISSKFHSGILDKTKVIISRLKVSEELGYIDIIAGSKTFSYKLKCSSDQKVLEYRLN